VGDVIEVGWDGSAADPDDMRLYQTFMVEPDVAANQALDGLAALVVAYNGGASEVGGRVDADAVAAVSGAVDSLTYLDGWVDRVGQGFRLADASGGPMQDEALDYFVGPADFAAAQREGYTFGDAPDDGPFGSPGIDARIVTRAGGTRVVVVTVDDATHEVSPQEWLLVAEHLGLDPRDGLLDVMIHGYNTPGDSAQAAGEAQADVYDAAGVTGATVLVLDWAGGNDFTQFHFAQSNTQLTGSTFGSLLDYVGIAEPAANVNITAHSMGNDVALKGLAEADHMPLTTDVDYIAVQPAVDSDFADQDPYRGALARVDHLDLTVNPNDSALGHYERWYGDGDPALGDDTPETALANLQAAGAPADTRIHQHDQDHAGLNPATIDITGDLVTERAEEEAAARR
jgi:hypothetical protein